ncbi:hypothetical protein [Streptomyces sp. NPDC047976]
MALTTVDTERQLVFAVNVYDLGADVSKARVPFPLGAGLPAVQAAALCG